MILSITIDNFSILFSRLSTISNSFNSLLQ